MLTHAMLYTILLEAEARVKDTGYPEEARQRSAETVSLCKQRIAAEGLTLKELKKLAKAK